MRFWIRSWIARLPLSDPDRQMLWAMRAWRFGQPGYSEINEQTVRLLRRPKCLPLLAQVYLARSGDATIVEALLSSPDTHPAALRELVECNMRPHDTCERARAHRRYPVA
jgi:hypothetical protein